MKLIYSMICDNFAALHECALHVFMDDNKTSHLQV